MRKEFDDFVIIGETIFTKLYKMTVLEISAESCVGQCGTFMNVW